MRRRRAEQGQTLVEFSLVASTLVLLLLACFQVGVVYFDQLSIEQGTRDGARKAVINRSLAPSAIIADAQAEVRTTASNLNQGTLNVTVTPFDNPDSTNGTLWEQGDGVTVRATYPWAISILGIVVASGTLDTQTSARME